jgi:hypothetical protein
MLSLRKCYRLEIPIPHDKSQCSFCMSSLWSLASRRGLHPRGTTAFISSSFTQRLRRLPPTRPFNWTPKQNAQYQIQPRFTRPQYQRFSQNKIPFYQSKRFWVTTGTGTVMFGGYYVMHLETVPISGRTRFMDITPQQEQGTRHMLRAYVIITLVRNSSSIHISYGKAGLRRNYEPIRKPNIASQPQTVYLCQQCR